jgi:hypothetical protein
MRVRPVRQLRTLLENLRASREKRTHCERDHLTECAVVTELAGRRCRNTSYRELTFRGGSVPAANGGEQLHVAAHRLRLVVIRLFERAESAKNICRLPNGQAKVAEIEWDVFESEEGTRFNLMSPKRVRREIEHRKWHATLNASLQREQFKVHVNSRRKLRMLRAKRLEFQGFTRLRSWT